MSKGSCALAPAFHQPVRPMGRGSGVEKAEKGRPGPLLPARWGTARDGIPPPSPGPGEGGLPARPGADMPGRGQEWASPRRDDPLRCGPPAAGASPCGGPPPPDRGDRSLPCSRPMGLSSSSRSWDGNMPPNARGKYPDIADPGAGGWAAHPIRERKPPARAVHTNGRGRHRRRRCEESLWGNDDIALADDRRAGQSLAAGAAFAHGPDRLSRGGWQRPAREVRSADGAHTHGLSVPVLRR